MAEKSKKQARDEEAEHEAVQNVGGRGIHVHGSGVYTQDNILEPMREKSSAIPVVPVPVGFLNLLSRLTAEAGVDSETVVKRALIPFGLANKARKEGLNLAVTDRDGNVVTNIEGF